MGGKLSCFQADHSLSDEYEFPEIDQSKAAIKIQNQFRRIHTNCKIPKLLQDKIITYYHEKKHIEIEPVSLETFNKQINPIIASSLVTLNKFDATIDQPFSNESCYDIDSLKINNSEYYKGQWTISCKKQGIGIQIFDNGCLYYGNFINDVKQGRGMLIQPNGDYYQGNFQNDLANGKGILYLKDEYKYTGLWKNNSKEGEGVEVYLVTGDKYEGNFKDNIKEGKGKYTYKDGTIYIGNFVNSKFEGEGTINWIDGRKYIGEFKNGKMHGRGKFIWPKGLEFEGEYDKGYKNGFGILRCQKGKTIKGYWRNNVLHGKANIINEDNEIVVEMLYRYGKIIKMISPRDNKILINGIGEMSHRINASPLILNEMEFFEGNTKYKS